MYENALDKREIEEGEIEECHEKHVKREDVDVAEEAIDYSSIAACHTDGCTIGLVRQFTGEKCLREAAE